MPTKPLSAEFEKKLKRWKFEQVNLFSEDEFPCKGKSPGDMGGTTGGERESNIRIVCCWDPGRWPDGGPTTPDVFWEYYLNDNVIETHYWSEAHGEVQGLEGLDSGERRGPGASGSQRPRGRQKRRVHENPT